MNISARITELRESRGMTTNALSKRAGVAQGHLREIELGHKQPGIEVLEKVCSGLDITLADFFADDNDMSIEMKRLIRATQKLKPDQIELLTKLIESL